MASTRVKKPQSLEDILAALTPQFSGGNDGFDDNPSDSDTNDLPDDSTGRDPRRGGDGDDSLRGGRDDDVIVGGTGTDLVFYDDSDDRVTIDLNSGVAVSRSHGRDILESVEGAHGSRFDDDFTGNGRNSRLFGEDGDDRFTVLGGDDHVDGGAGSDSVYWHGFRRQHTIKLGAGDDSVSDATGTTTLAGVERLVFADGVMVKDVGDDAAKIYRLYQATLDRDPDGGGLKAWYGGLKGGMNLSEITGGFVNSGEFRQKYGDLDDDSFVRQLYRNVLDREGEQSGVDAWVGGLKGGLRREDIVLGFSESGEHVEKSRSAVEKGLWLRDDDAASVARLYDTLLDRLPDAPGLGGWLSAIRSGMTLEQVADSFATAAEFQQKYGSLDDKGFVEQLYRNVLDREGEDSGIEAWHGGLKGGMSRAEVALGFSESAEHQSKSAAYVDDGVWYL